MSNRVSLVVLCEDEFHQQFVNAFLDRIDLPFEGRRRLERAGGKELVFKAFPQEVRALRGAHVQTRLIVVMDADELSDAQIADALSKRLRDAKLDPDYSKDPVLVVRPRWELENWALWLLGEPIGEDYDRSARRKVGDRGRDAARALAEACKIHREPAACPPSLAQACREWESHRKRHGY